MKPSSLFCLQDLSIINFTLLIPKKDKLTCSRKYFTRNKKFLKMNSTQLNGEIGKKKFTGSLVGALIGDVYGSPYEGVAKPDLDEVQNTLDRRELHLPQLPLLSYTDDTAMTNGLLESLTEVRSFNEKDIAKRFVNNYFKEPDRGYGESVVTVFKKMKKVVSTYGLPNTELYKAAQEQFDGDGSLGNGGAMRIAPIALFHHKNYDTMLENAEKCTKITHSHILGVNGALLQAIAVHKALYSDPSKPLDTEEFLDYLLKKMLIIESGSDQPYCQKLKTAKNLLTSDADGRNVVAEILGNGVTALSSVVTAIFCFLRAQDPILSIKSDNKFRRTIQFSINVGGDTDTIASMAGAISGAYHGHDIINKNLKENCEGLPTTFSMAEHLHEITTYL